MAPYTLLLGKLAQSLLKSAHRFLKTLKIDLQTLPYLPPFSFKLIAFFFITVVIFIYRCIHTSTFINITCSVYLMLLVYMFTGLTIG